MTITPTQTIDELATSVARIRSYMRKQSKPGHIAFVPAADALELLAYVSALERDRDAWRAVATRAERRTDSE